MIFNNNKSIIHNRPKKILARLRHRITSNSSKGFGIHSPFMFDFITNVVNEKNPYYSYKEIENRAQSNKEEKYLKLIYRIINYYKIKNVLFLGQDKYTERLLGLCKNINIDTTGRDNIDGYDFVYIADIGTLPDESIQSSDVIICINNIYNNSKLWNRLKRIGISKIFIDFFDFGIIFAKNNFQTQIYKITF